MRRKTTSRKDDDRVVARVGDFSDREVIGRGNFGTVYRAVWHRNDAVEDVAIKVIDLEESEDDPIEVQREIDMMRSCASPYTVALYCSFLVESKLWIVMELMHNSVKNLMQVALPDEPAIACILKQTLEALAFLHQRRMIHRDLKVANLLLSEQGEVKLGDFGVSTSIEARLKAFSFVGTPYSLAPEVVCAAGGDTKMDIWGAGIAAYELATGQPPYQDPEPVRAVRMIVQGPPPRLVGEHSDAFKDFVAHALIKDPGLRPSARELLRHRFMEQASKESLRTWIAATQGAAMHSQIAEDEEEEAGADDTWLFDTVGHVSRPPPQSLTPTAPIDESSPDLVRMQQVIYLMTREARFAPVNRQLLTLSSLFVQLERKCPDFTRDFAALVLAA